MSVASPIPVAILGLDGVQSLDVTGPMEVFAVANQFLEPAARYALVIGSLTGEPVRTHAGMEIGPARALSDLPEALDTIVVAGGGQAEMIAALTGPHLVPFLQARARRTRRIASVCTGAFVLAAAGFLNGRRATTHWRNCAQLQTLFPAIRVEPDAIFVAEPPFYTSAGVTAGIDLCLALVEADHGPQVARSVARELVLFLRRPGGQSQFSAGQGLPAAVEPRLQQLVAALLDDPTGPASLPDLAARAGMSERTFSRRFRRSVGQSPAQFVEAARLARAKALLESSDWPLERVSERAGFGAADALFRAFQKQLGISPGEYRARFAAALPSLPSLSALRVPIVARGSRAPERGAE